MLLDNSKLKDSKQGYEGKTEDRIKSFEKILKNYYKTKFGSSKEKKAKKNTNFASNNGANGKIYTKLFIKCAKRLDDIKNIKRKNNLNKESLKAFRKEFKS